MEYQLMMRHLSARLRKRAKGKYQFVTGAESGHHPCESTSVGLRVYTTPNRQVAGLRVNTTLEALSSSIVSEVDADSQDGVDHHVANICVNVIRYASEWERNDDEVILGFMH